MKEEYMAREKKGGNESYTHVPYQRLRGEKHV
jgi:hypothetical protein